MNQQTYRKITDGIRGLQNGQKIVQFINSIATKIVYMAYVVGIIILFDEKILHNTDFIDYIWMSSLSPRSGERGGILLF